MGHPREPHRENAHPHLDCTGRLAIIHNGIIENHAELRVELEAAGHTITSGTDTEVMVHLVEAEVARGATLEEATRTMLRRVRGAFSIAVISADEPDTIVAARRSTPLVLGLHDGMALLASDIPALIEHTRQVYALADDELAVLTPGALRVVTLEGEPVEPEQLKITYDLEAAQRGGYEDFMSKEMHEQPQAVADTLLDRRGGRGELVLDEMRLSARRAARRRQGVHHRLRLELPRGHGGQVRHRALGQAAGRGRHRQRVPLPRSGAERAHPVRRGVAVG